MQLRNFIITVTNGEITFKNSYHQALFKKFLRQFENGKEHWLSVDPKIPKRNEQQNRYYWLYLNLIARDTGHTPEELHEYFKNKFLRFAAREIFGEKLWMHKSTTDLSKQEFSEYIENIESMTGIKPPDVELFMYG